MLNIDGAFQRAASEATAFARLVKKKGEPTDPKLKERYRALEVGAMSLAGQAGNGHYFETILKLLFFKGVAFGMGIATEEELAGLGEET